MSYHGVYSPTGAGTSIGTELLSNSTGSKITGVTTEGRSKDNRSYITTGDLKDADLTIAKIRVVSTIPNKSVDDEVKDKAFVGFILTGVQESHAEKLELVPLPGDSFASYFYGANPRQFSFNGMLLNTDQDRWRDAFEELYEKHLRGSVSSRQFNIVQVSYNGRVISGWLTSLSQQLDSGNDRYAMFSFTVLVSRIDMVGGSKKFGDYMTSSISEFEGADISADYAILDSSNYNALIDPIRTGMVIPPKRPKRAGGRGSKKPSCWFPSGTTTGGQPILNGALTANDHINDAARCSVIELAEGTIAKVKDLYKQADEKSNKGDLTEAKRLRSKAASLSKSLEDNLARKEVKEKLAEEAEGIVKELKDSGDAANISSSNLEEAYGITDTVTSYDIGGGTKIDVFETELSTSLAKFGITTKIDAQVELKDRYNLNRLAEASRKTYLEAERKAKKKREEQARKRRENETKGAVDRLAKRARKK